VNAASPFERESQRERRRRETRARLYQAALAEFAAKGFDRARVADIARAAEVSRPTFYFHFPTKEHVLLELQWHKELAICERLREASSLPEALRILPDALVEALESVEPGVARDMLRIYARPPEGLSLDDQPYPLIHELARFFAEGAARSELRAGLPPERAPLLCLTGVFGYLMAADPESDRRADLRALTGLYLNADPRH
jgi:AcrR family transcriptional regulator